MFDCEGSTTDLCQKVALKRVIDGSGLIIIDSKLSVWELASSDALHGMMAESSAKHWSTSQFRCRPSHRELLLPPR